MNFSCGVLSHSPGTLNVRWLAVTVSDERTWAIEVVFSCGCGFVCDPEAATFLAKELITQPTDADWQRQVEGTDRGFRSLSVEDILRIFRETVRRRGDLQ